MKFIYFILSVTVLFSCKKENEEISNRFNAINDKDYLDSIKAEYNNYYINPNDKSYKFHLGINDFCYDNTRLKVHKILFSDKKDERITGEFPAYKALEKINDSILNTFSIKEKLVFALIYPEKHSQTCGRPIELNEETNKFIFTRIPSGEEGFYASERQLNALKANPDSVSYYLTDCYSVKEEIPYEIYKFIIKLRLYKTIPFLIEENNKKPNSFILAVFINLMFEDNYKPFMDSKLLKDMKDDTHFGENIWDFRAIEKTPERLDQLISLTQSFYKWKLTE